MSDPPKLARNWRIAREAIGGVSCYKLATKYGLSRQTIRDAIRVALKADAPEFVGAGMKDLRIHKDDLRAALSGIPRAEVLESDPWEAMRRAAKGVGLSPGATESLVKRLLKLEPTLKVAREISTKDLQDLLTEKAFMALQCMDQVSFAKADLASLGKTLGILITNRQLLSGEPTQITSSIDREKMHELLERAIQIAKQRGITVDLDPQEYTVQ